MKPSRPRDLSEFEIAYLFIDGLAERLRPGQKKDAVLGAWGIDFDGKKHLLHLSPGTKEDTESVQAFIQDMKRRGLRDPLLVTTDGAGRPGPGRRRVVPPKRAAALPLPQDAEPADQGA